MFLKRNSADEETRFVIYDQSGRVKYKVKVLSEKFRQKIDLVDSDDIVLSEITHKDLVLHYFTVRCCGRFVVLAPQIKDCFYFILFGSNYRFAGDIGSGSFSLFDVDKTTLMTQKKCWSRWGDSYELKILRPEDELFAVSCAVCADMYIAVSDHSRVLSE